MSTLITVLHIIVCLFLMLTVLLQSGKGGGMGAAFGGGNAATVFGGSGAGSFLRNLTAGAGTIFMLTSMVLAFISSHNSADSLEKFGEQQATLAEQKDKAKEKAVEDAKKAGSGSGSASSTQIQLPNGSNVPLEGLPEMPTITVGSGSATTPAPTTPATGSGSAAPKATPPVTPPAAPKAIPTPAVVAPKAPTPTPAPAPVMPTPAPTTPAPTTPAPAPVSPPTNP